MSVYVVVVNYNGWADTVECLETLFRSRAPSFRVVVCDNGSGDGSLERIAAWAQGNLAPAVPEGEVSRRLFRSPLARPIPWVRYSRAEAERGGDPGEDAPLVLIDCGGNLGFAGGNNVGLRYALRRADFQYAWLLNNDTAVEADALAQLQRRLDESPGAGLCGSTLLEYGRPERVQALGGGWYCRWLGLAWHLGRLRRWSGSARREKVERLMHYPVGASVMVSRPFLEEVGLMTEDYFLYFEELDWVLRARGRFGTVYAPGSVVYHKVGASIGTSSNPGRKSFACDYYNARNRLLFTRRWFPLALPTVYLGVVGTLAARVFLGRWDRAAMLLRLLAGRDGF